MLTDITTITKGVIMHQVNCQNVMGAGVAKALYTKYPQVKEQFHQLATQPEYNTPQKRFGHHCRTKLDNNTWHTPGLYVAPPRTPFYF